MSEYLIQDTTLTGIADKIRPLLGLTGTMTPEQMQTNLTTEQANIAAALAALTEKGVEVPTGSNSNALAGLIAAIEAGGVEIKTINTVLAETISGKPFAIFELDKENMPSVVISFNAPESTAEMSTTSGYLVEIYFLVKNDPQSGFVQYKEYIWSYNIGVNKNLAPYVATRNAVKGEVSLNMCSANNTLVAGVTYRTLIIWGLDVEEGAT